MSFSQHIKPKIQLIDGREYFCFELSQSKLLATELQLKKLSDSLVLVYQKKEALFQLLLEHKDTTEQLLKNKQQYLEIIISKKNIIISEKERELQVQSKKHKASRFLNKVLTIGALTVSGILIVK